MEKTRGFSEVELRRRRRVVISSVIRYIVLIVVALVMIYPIIWLVLRSVLFRNGSTLLPI